MAGVVCLVAMSREAVGVFTDTYISEIAGKDAIVCGDLGVRGPESGVGEYGFAGAGQIPTQSGLPVAAREQAYVSLISINAGNSENVLARSGRLRPLQRVGWIARSHAFSACTSLHEKFEAAC